MEYICRKLRLNFDALRSLGLFIPACRGLAGSLALVLYALCGFAVDAQARVIRIVTIAVAPFGMESTGGKKSGSVFEIGNLIAEEAGLQYENTILPYSRALAMIESGDADLLIALPSDRLNQKAKQIVRVTTLENIVIGRRGTQYRVLEDLHGKVVGTIREAKYDARFSADTEIKKYNTNNYEQGINMLFAERLDAVIGVKEGIYFALQSIGGTRAMLGEPLMLSRQDAWLHFSNKGYDELIAVALKNAVTRLQQRNAIQKIDEKYLGAFSKN